MLRKRLILHVGLPKTGSTALQYWCNKNRDQLKSFDINYPKTCKKLYDPKHQFLLWNLIKNDFKKLRHTLSENSSNNIILSTEALTDYFYGNT